MDIEYEMRKAALRGYFVYVGCSSNGAWQAWANGCEGERYASVGARNATAALESVFNKMNKGGNFDQVEK